MQCMTKDQCICPICGPSRTGYFINDEYWGCIENCEDDKGEYVRVFTQEDFDTGLGVVACAEDYARMRRDYPELFPPDEDER